MTFDIHGFLTITNQQITLNGKEGWHLMSIEVTSASTASLTITGSITQTIGGIVCTNIVLAPGESISLGSGSSEIDGVTLDAPSGCNVKIAVVALRSPYFIR